MLRKLLNKLNSVPPALYTSAIEGTLTDTIWKTVKGLWKKCWKEADRIIGIIFRYFLKNSLPTVQNKVFFHTQENKYTCNPKYITEELRRQGFGDLDVVWKMPKKDRGGVPEGIRAVPINTVEYFRELYSSKVIITNSFLFLGVPVKLKKDQILLQTWHGSLGIKKYGQDDIHDYWRRVMALKQTGQMTSYCISNSDLENHSFRDTYWPKTPIVEYGHARNDLFFDNFKEKRAELKKKIFEEYGIDEDMNVIMYGPTFRDDKSLKYYDIDFKKLLETVTKKFGGKWCLFLRYHPSMSKVREIATKTEALQRKKLPVYNVTDYLDMQELIAVTDIAVTDYSSWIYDFVLMRKPGFIFATDIESYDRGFYYPIETTPFAISRSSDQLMKDIMAYDEASYLEKVEAFLVEKGCVDDGHAAERVVRMIRDLTKGKRPKDAIRKV